VVDTRRVDGRVFQIVEPETAKLRSPLVTVLVLGIYMSPNSSVILLLRDNVSLLNKNAHV